MCCLCADEMGKFDQLKCPVCNVDIATPPLPNVGLAAFAEVQAALSSDGEGASGPELECVDCLRDDEQVIASHLCRTCDNRPLCDLHQLFHSERKKHDVGAFATRPVIPSSQCVTHPALAASRFCVTDGVVICAECLVGEHAGHNVVALDGGVAVLREGVLASIARCESSADAMLKGLIQLQAAKDRCNARFEASRADLLSKATAAKAAIDAAVARIVLDAGKVKSSMLKALDAQLDEWTVSANQLACAVGLGTRALGSGTAVEIAHAHTALSMASKLIRSYTGPKESALVEIVASSEVVDDVLPKFARIRTGVHAAQSKGSGPNVMYYDSAESNVITLQLRDDTGAIVESETPEDIVVSLEAVADPAVGGPTTSTVPASKADGSPLPEPDVSVSVLGVTATDPGTFAISFTSGAGVDHLSVAVNAAGCVGAGGNPWRVRRIARLGGSTCAARGVYLYQIRVDIANKVGMAVSPDEKYMVVADYGEGHCLVVYSLPDGEIVRKIGGPGSGSSPGMFQNAGKLCFTPQGTLLCSDYGSGRIQELTLEGEHVRTYNINCGYTVALSAAGDTMAVGNCRGSANAIEVYERATGKLIISMGPSGSEPGHIGSQCEGLRFTPDGLHILACEHYNRRLSLFTLEGKFVRHIGDKLVSNGYKDVDFTAAGEIILADYNNNRVCVFSADGSELLRAWGSSGTGNGEFNCPTALSVRGSRLYVLDRNNPRVQVFE